MSENRNPWTGEPHRHTPHSPAQVEASLQAAAAAFPAWAALDLDARGECLHRIAAVLKARRRELAALATTEMGKLTAEALAEVDKSASACAYYADHAAGYLRDVPIGA